MNAPEQYHQPVLVKEVLEALAPRPGQLVIDGNLGHGGHSLQIMSRLGEEGLLVGVDRDPQMLATARKRFEDAGVPRSRYRLVEADHLQLPVVLAEVLADAPVAAPVPAEVPVPDSILFDLGPSTPQLLDPERGMSWDSDFPLDMRLSRADHPLTAQMIVNEWDEPDLARLFRENADERWAVRIAKRIVETRERKPIVTGRDLGRLVGEAIPRGAWPPKIHPATRVFLALRIEVNGEYRTLDAVLPLAFGLLKPGGRLAVISFHSGEDRRVKDFMRRVSTPPEVPWPLPQSGAPGAAARPLTRKPLGPGPEELAANPRARSARLRAVEKLGEPSGR
jgi:16S rRNA (cytosine1402-N4)-methyltransferase